MYSLPEKRDRLIETLKSYESCAVAFSGGVDSAVVAKAAQLALGTGALAVTGVSASLPQGELEDAGDLAKLIGIRHVVISTDEFQDENYTQNAPDRCYHCKTELYTKLASRIDELQVAVIANGANQDDLADYRPGLQAASELRVRSPLAEGGFTKLEVRALAAEWKLPVWDKPAGPCLSSRIAYGEQVTPQRLRMVDDAERFLRSHGLSQVRVRYHQGDMARLEVPLEDLPRLIEADFRTQLVAKVKELGFRFVTLDLEGFRSGSLNTLVPIDALWKANPAAPSREHHS